MGRQGGKCRRCGAQRRGGRRYVTGSASFTACAKCGTPICGEHAMWDSAAGLHDEGAYVCQNISLCQRDSKRVS